MPEPSSTAPAHNAAKRNLDICPRSASDLSEASRSHRARQLHIGLAAVDGLEIEARRLLEARRGGLELVLRQHVGDPGKAVGRALFRHLQYGFEAEIAVADDHVVHRRDALVL